MGVHHIAVRYQLRLGGGEGVGAIAGEIPGRGGRGGGAGTAAHRVLHLLILACQSVWHGLLHDIVIRAAAQRHHVGKLRHLPGLQGKVPLRVHLSAAGDGGALQHLVRRTRRHIQAAVGPQHPEPVVQRPGEIAVQRLPATGQLLGHRQGLVGQRGHVEPQIAVGHVAAPLQIEEFQCVLGVVGKRLAAEGALHPGGAEFCRQCGRLVILRPGFAGQPRFRLRHRAVGKVDGAAVGAVGAADIQHQHIVDIHEHIVVAQELEHHVLPVDLSPGGHEKVELHGHAEPHIRRAVRQAVGLGGFLRGRLRDAGHVVERQEIAIEGDLPVLKYRFAFRVHIIGVVGPHDAVVQPEPSCSRVIPGGVLQRIVVQILLAVPLEQTCATAAAHVVGGLARHTAAVEQIPQTAALLAAGDAVDIGPAVHQRSRHTGPCADTLRVAVHRRAVPLVVEEIQRALPADVPGIVEQPHSHIVPHRPCRPCRPQRAHRVTAHGIDAVLFHFVGAPGGVHADGQQCGAQRQCQQAAQQPPCDPFVFVHAPSSCLCQCGKVFAFRGGL